MAKPLQKLTFVQFEPSVKGPQAYSLVKCVCGVFKVVYTQAFKHNRTKSCGGRWCVERSHARRHGMTGTPVHDAWHGMRARCRNKKHKSYPSYGGRGIAVCKRWEVFESFYEDMGDRPSKKHSIGRIDNNKGYSPSNCRWELHEQQDANTRTNVYFTVDGKRQHITAWSRQLGISNSVLYRRIHANCTEAQFCRKPTKRNPEITWKGDSCTVSVWAEKTGISIAQIQRRLAAGYPLEMVFYAGRLNAPDAPLKYRLAVFARLAENRKGKGCKPR